MSAGEAAEVNDLNEATAPNAAIGPRSAAGARQGRKVRLKPRWKRRKKTTLAETNRLPGPLTLSPVFDALFHFFEGGRPIITEEFGEGPIPEEFASGLTARAVVGRAFSVYDALDRRPTPGAGLTELSVRRHRLVECGDLLGKLVTELDAEALDPLLRLAPRAV